MNGRSTVVSERKEAVFEKGGAVYDRKEIINEVGGAVDDRKGSVFYAGDAVNGRKEAVSNADVAVNKKKEAVLHADIAVNGRKEAAFVKDGGDVPQISLKERRCGARKEIINEVGGAVYDRKGSIFSAGGVVNGRKEAVSNADVGVNKKKAVFHADVAVNGRKEAAFLKDGGADQQISLKERRWEATPRSLLQKQIRPEPIDIYVVGSNSHVRSNDPAEETKVSGTAEKRETAELGNDRIAPYNTPKGSQRDISSMKAL